MWRSDAHCLERHSTLPDCLRLNAHSVPTDWLRSVSKLLALHLDFYRRSLTQSFPVPNPKPKPYPYPYAD